MIALWSYQRNTSLTLMEINVYLDCVCIFFRQVQTERSKHTVPRGHMEINT